MLTVVIPTTNRPEMLRTALRSVAKQTARKEIALVLVSENANGERTESTCAEFSSLPIRFVKREPVLPPMDHGEALFREADAAGNAHIAILHDDDWWADEHLANALRYLGEDSEVVAYWSASYLVHGESSWIMQMWNMSCWVATDFGPLDAVVKMGPREAALAAIGSGPAHYSSLVAPRRTLLECMLDVKKTGNLFDNDRLLFLELTKRGPVLVKLLPEVFVRQHAGQDQRTMPLELSTEHVGAATRLVLNFCRNYGVDVVAEYSRLYDICPIPAYKPYLLEQLFDTRVIKELERQDKLPLRQLLIKAGAIPEKRGVKWFLHQITPPFFWLFGKSLSKRLQERSA